MSLQPATRLAAASSTRSGVRAFSCTAAAHAKPRRANDATDVMGLRKMEEFRHDDIPTLGHRMLQRKRELLHYARLADSEMPKLKGQFAQGAPVRGAYTHLAPCAQPSPSRTSRLRLMPFCACAPTTIRATRTPPRARPSSLLRWRIYSARAHSRVTQQCTSSSCLLESDSAMSDSRSRSRANASPKRRRTSDGQRRGSNFLSRRLT